MNSINKVYIVNFTTPIILKNAMRKQHCIYHVTPQARLFCNQKDRDYILMISYTNNQQLSLQYFDVE